MGWNGTWKTKGRPSEARLKFFDETFLQKSFDLALTRRAAHKRKLGKQPGNLWLPAPFPDGSAVALSALLWRAPPPKGEARLGFLQASGELPTWLPLWGSWHGVAVTERASSRDAVAARRLRGQPASAPHSSVSPRRRLYQRAAHALGGVTGKLGAKISAAPGGTEDPRRGSST